MHFSGKQTLPSRQFGRKTHFFLKKTVKLMTLHMSCSSYLIVLFIWKIQGGHFLRTLRSSSCVHQVIDSPPPAPPPPLPPPILLPIQEQSGHIKQWALEYSPCRTPLASATFYATWSNVLILLDIHLRLAWKIKVLVENVKITALFILPIWIKIYINEMLNNCNFSEWTRKMIILWKKRRLIYR